jgi:hypothetical protein
MGRRRPPKKIMSGRKCHRLVPVRNEFAARAITASTVAEPRSRLLCRICWLIGGDPFKGDGGALLHDRVPAGDDSQCSTANGHGRLGRRATGGY